MAKKLTSSHFPGELGKGPGAYDVRGKQKNDNYAYTMRSKLEDIEFKKQNFTPGPGKYSL
jgi:hypothetical protein